MPLEQTTPRGITVQCFSYRCALALREKKLLLHCLHAYFNQDGSGQHHVVQSTDGRLVFLQDPPCAGSIGTFMYRVTELIEPPSYTILNSRTCSTVL